MWTQSWKKIFTKPEVPSSTNSFIFVVALDHDFLFLSSNNFDYLLRVDNLIILL